LILIQSKDNDLFKETRKLKERKNRSKNNKYIIEGYRLVEEAFKANMDIEYLIFNEKENDKMDTYINKYLDKEIKIYCMKDVLFNELISTEQTQGIIAVIKMNSKELEYNKEFYILCDKVQDPGNLGTIIRTAHASGADGIILTKGSVDIYNEKTLRASMGSIFYIPVVYDDENLSILKKLEKEGFNIVVTSLQTDKDFYEESLKGKVVLTVGNEGNGVSKEVYELATTKVKLPMPGKAESLNVAIAASVIMYEKVRQENSPNIR